MKSNQVRVNRRLRKLRRGAALVEYSMLIAGVALIAAAAVSIFGHKTSDLIAAVASVLPGAHAEDNAPIETGKLVETTAGTAANPIELDTTAITTNSNTARLGVNVGLDTPADFGGLVVEP